MIKNKIVLYQHSGSGNHGCEAIVRSLVKITGKEVDLVSFRPEDDKKYGLEESGVSVHGVKYIKGISLKRIYLYIMRHVFRNSCVDHGYLFQEIVKQKNKIVASIGGDLYCVSDTKHLAYMNKLLGKNNWSVLLGCSIETEKLKDSEVIDDMKKYHLISARETLTYNALINAGVKDNVILCADPAFQLDEIKLPLPEGFKEGNTIGLNLSPLIINRECKNGIVENAFENLIRYIIDNSNYQIALIPHVVWSGVSDFDALKIFYDKFKDTKRVVLIEDGNCMQLKGYISRCELFIGARTHATIAAYSTCVPTVVVGYSVKSQGIAKDLFGTTENYVLPIAEIKVGSELVDSFIWLEKNKTHIKEHLNLIMPEYKQSCFKVKEELQKLWENK